jgi:hypothetical protein
MKEPEQMKTTSLVLCAAAMLAICVTTVPVIAQPAHTADAAQVREVYETAIVRGDPDPCFYLPYEWARTECNVRKSAADQLAHQIIVAQSALTAAARERAAWAKSLTAYLSVANDLAEARSHERALAAASAPIVIMR